MAAVHSIGRADHVAPRPGAEETGLLYQRYGHRIQAYCLHQLSSREEAEDAVQTTFLNAFRGLSRGLVPESEQAWLFKIAENVCLSRRRTSWRRGRIESPSDFELLQDLAPAPARDRADELIGLEDALAAMPESQRRAILLREWQGLSYREIADELEVSQAAVETLIFRARRTLANGLEDPKRSKRRRRPSLGLGVNVASLLAGLKGLLTGSAAVKAVAVAVAAGSATVAATEVERIVVPRHPKPAQPTLRAPLARPAPPPGVSVRAAAAPEAAAPDRPARAQKAKAAPGDLVPPEVTPPAVETPAAAEPSAPEAPAVTPPAEEAQADKPGKDEPKRGKTEEEKEKPGKDKGKHDRAPAGVAEPAPADLEPAVEDEGGKTKKDKKDKKEPESAEAVVLPPAAATTAAVPEAHVKHDGGKDGSKGKDK
ncbi:MAG: RNA polymerase sigma factor [Gaiellaceae bacterium]